MKKTFKALKFPIVFILFLLSFIACDKDFTTIESDVLGEGNANFFTDSSLIKISAYNKKLEALKINNLSSSLLGIFNDPEFGQTKASIITQLTPSSASLDKSFDVNPVIDSVVITIPYYSTENGFDDDGNTTYQLDSVYGNLDSKFKLTIHQNNYFLKDFDPSGDSNTSLNYYTKTEALADASHNYALTETQEIDFDNHLGELIYENNDFNPSAESEELWEISTTDTVKTRITPAIRISFKSEVTEDADEIDFWQQTIIAKAGDLVLSNANNFRDYFRGLYFKADGDNGSMFLLNLDSSNANITIYFTEGEDTDRNQDEFILTFTGNKLNTFNNNFDVTLTDGDKNNGDETLYIKGLEGSMAIVDLFGPDLDGDLVPDELDNFLKEYRKTDEVTGEFITDSDGDYVLKRLVNEAHLAIYEDESGIPSTTQVGTFFTNTNITALGEMTYQGLALLDENSVYWVVIDINDGAEASYTFNNIVYSDPSTGGANIPSDIISLGVFNNFNNSSSSSFDTYTFVPSSAVPEVFKVTLPDADPIVGLATLFNVSFATTLAVLPPVPLSIDANVSLIASIGVTGAEIAEI